MKISTGLQCVLFFAVLLTASVVFADPDGQTVEELNEAGVTAFSNGDYVTAADLFARAYAIDARPELLKNRSVALYRADRCDDALPTAAEFLKTSPTDAESTEIRALQSACYVSLAEAAIARQAFEEATQLLDRVGEDPTLEIRVARVQNAIAAHQEDELKKRARKIEEAEEKEERRKAEKRREAQRDEDYRRRTTASIPEETTNTPALIFITLGTATILGAGIYHIYEKAVTEPEFEEVASSATSRSRYNQLDARLRVANWLVPTLYAIGLAELGVGFGFIFFKNEENYTPGVSWRGSF